jgi:hypothetical protein
MKKEGIDRTTSLACEWGKIKKYRILAKKYGWKKFQIT